MVDGDNFVTTQGVEDLNTCPQQSQDVASPAAALRVTSEDGHPVTLKGSEAAELSPCGATAGPGGRQARVTAHSPEKWVRWAPRAQRGWHSAAPASTWDHTAQAAPLWPGDPSLSQEAG